MLLKVVPSEACDDVGKPCLHGNHRAPVARTHNIFMSTATSLLRYVSIAEAAIDIFAPCDVGLARRISVLAPFWARRTKSLNSASASKDRQNSRIPGVIHPKRDRRKWCSVSQF